MPIPLVVGPSAVYCKVDCVLLRYEQCQKCQYVYIIDDSCIIRLYAGNSTCIMALIDVQQSLCCGEVQSRRVPVES